MVGRRLSPAGMSPTEQAKSDATLGWDASPITTARLCAEVYAQIKDEDWSLVGNAIRANLNTTLDVSSMNIIELRAAGGAREVRVIRSQPQKCFS